MIIRAAYIVVSEDYADTKLLIVKWQNKKVIERQFHVFCFLLKSGLILAKVIYKPAVWLSTGRPV